MISLFKVSPLEATLESLNSKYGPVNKMRGLLVASSIFLRMRKTINNPQSLGGEAWLGLYVGSSVGLCRVTLLYRIAAFLEI